jgi:hypothetical protein
MLQMIFTSRIYFDDVGHKLCLIWHHLSKSLERCLMYLLTWVVGKKKSLGTNIFCRHADRSKRGRGGGWEGEQRGGEKRGGEGRGSREEESKRGKEGNEREGAEEEKG